MLAGQDWHLHLTDLFKHVDDQPFLKQQDLLSMYLPHTPGLHLQVQCHLRHH